MVKWALCGCGGVVPRKGPGSFIGLCPECLGAQQRQRWANNQRNYRSNHGLTSSQAVTVVNPIGMRLRRSTYRPGRPRAKNPRYLAG
jgi:hypothetical protein